ncbi:uncharacterized protein DSM5745_10949 [Aspergillus mulundensis]|uniref:Uncharacterized protein n=1 Tax=Aspergillus mulundensis TaxID=1810919 RepID=A0A3D8QFK5_9EURO|nr:Uncharacterized protein DSM5745_10949 [Aspergillus mulundensis]RDW60491.1 Uncharacterized protein DSM5745_10949 [Aspergillus mulundensis]
MLFNLGLTADAAAAHNSELASPQTETQHSMPSRVSSPRPFSFSNLPSWGLGSRFSGEKTAETGRPRFEQRRSMPITAIEPRSSSDEDRYSTAGPSPVRQYSQHKHPKQSSPRPKTIYQLAHPATNARHKRLKLRPKLLLQLQQVSSTSRPVPVFDVLPSTLFMPRLARKVPAALRGKRGLGPNDLIVTTSDLYQPTVGEGADRNLSSDEENGDHREVVATICQPCKEDALSKGKAEICLNSGTVWEATPLPNGSYEFAANTDSGLMILRWVRRGPKKRRMSAPPGSIPPEDTRRFTFSVIDPTTRRHPVIASMARNHLEIYDRYSLPSTAPSSPTSTALSVISDASEMDLPLDQQVMETDEKLRLLITITSIWVAFREGWSHNFRYNDIAVTGRTGRSASISNNVSTPVQESEDDTDKQTSADPNRRVVTWTAAASQPPATDRSTQYGSLSKRSNSTGAAFLEKANRRNSSMNRHNMASPRQSYDASFEPKNVRPDLVSGSWSQQRKADRENTKFESPIRPKATHRSKQEDRQTAADDKLESLRPTKGKRRHRLSNLFDFLIRKSGHHRQ